MDSFIYAGVLWILNGGSDEMITKAKKIMTYAILGILVILLSYSAVTFVASSLQGGKGGGNSGGSSQVQSNKKPNNSANPANPADSVKSGSTKPVVSRNLDQIDDLVKNLKRDLDLSGLSKVAKAEVEKALMGGTLSQKIQRIKAILKNPSQFGVLQSDIDLLSSFLNGLENLKLLRETLDDLRKKMPESRLTIQSYDETSDALDTLIDDPDNLIKYKRFEAKYQKLKDLINQFPVMTANIVAFPSEGNVPFTVQFNGLNSVDPNGGTIASYRWSYLDKSGSEVVIGTDPVVTYEFKEPNTYGVQLQVSTAQKDGQGYKTSSDGVSNVRIKANPPTSKVQFRINGAAAQEIMTFTLKEAQAGLSFDPSSTTAALGRKITKYDWSYGDGQKEVRQVPSTVIHTFNEPGEYFVKLEVTDNLQEKDRRIIKIFVKSLASEIRMNPPKGNVNTEFRFDGSGSRSDDGVITDFKWEIRSADGQLVADSEESLLIHRFNRPGDYQLSLVVTDITGSKDQSIKRLKIESRNPIARFNHSIPKRNHPNQVQFSAINSYDPDEGDQLTYSWDFDGDGKFEITKGSESSPSYEYSKVGENRVILQVEDAFGKRSSIERKVSIKSILSADIETSKKVVRVGDPITFKVKNSNAVSYLWEFGDNEKKSTDESEVKYTYNKTGKYEVKLNFFDKDDSDNFDTQRILVGAADEPMALINYTINMQDQRLISDLCGQGKDGVLVGRNDRIRFDGRESLNSDGSSRLLSYNWTFPAGEKSSDKTPNYKFDEINREGKCFLVSLRVKDNLSGKLSKEDVIYFKVINQLPTITDLVLEADKNKEEFITPLKVKTRVIGPQDKDGSIKKYKWWYYREGFENQRIGLHTTSVPESNLTITSFGQPNVANRYFFVVELIDNDGGVYSSEEQFSTTSFIEVKNGPNLSPVADFTVDKTTISAGDSVTFFSRSYDPQGDTLPNDAYRWDFDGDGVFDDTSSGSQVNRQFNTPGEYKARLKVVYRGLSSSVTQNIVVEQTESLPQPAFTYVVDGNTVEFDASNTRFDPTLEDTNLRFEWDFDLASDANGNGLKDDDNQSNEVKTTFTYDQKGRYRIRLKVTDSLGVESVVVREIDLNLTELERLKNTSKTLKISASKHPITVLNLELVPSEIEKGGSADIQAQILNADNSPYNGKVFFEVIEGTGQFSPNPVEAKDSLASTVFSSVDTGLVRIRVRATETLYGEITEDITINIK